MDFINSQVTLYPDLAEEYATLGELHEKKLWHQLSLSLETFLSNGRNIRGNNAQQLYDGFVRSFEARLNQVKLAGLVTLVSKTLNDANALDFINTVLAARKRLGVEASMCLDMDVVTIKLRLGDVEAAKGLLESAKEQLSSIKPSESVIFSKYYKAQTEYRKVVGPANEFYSAALMFLSYTNVEDLSAEERYTLATDMALASVTGDDIYNFGEVLATPILSVLKNSPNEWMLVLVEAMNSGNVDQFNQVVEAHRAQYFAQPALASKHESVVSQKIVLLSLVNIAFEKPSHERVIPFADIAERSRIPLEQVEWVLMRAMSLGLLKGTLDGVEGTVSITWVQPRVLDKEQIKLLADQLAVWVDKTKSALVTIEEQTAELF